MPSGRFDLRNEALRRDREYAAGAARAGALSALVPRPSRIPAGGGVYRPVTGIKPRTFSEVGTPLNPNLPNPSEVRFARQLERQAAMDAWNTPQSQFARELDARKAEREEQRLDDLDQYRRANLGLGYDKLDASAAQKEADREARIGMSGDRMLMDQARIDMQRESAKMRNEQQQRANDLREKRSAGYLSDADKAQIAVLDKKIEYLWGWEMSPNLQDEEKRLEYERQRKELERQREAILGGGGGMSGAAVSPPMPSPPATDDAATTMGAVQAPPARMPDPQPKPQPDAAIPPAPMPAMRESAIPPVQMPAMQRQQPDPLEWAKAHRESSDPELRRRARDIIMREMGRTPEERQAQGLLRDNFLEGMQDDVFQRRMNPTGEASQMPRQSVTTAQMRGAAGFAPTVDGQRPFGGRDQEMIAWARANRDSNDPETRQTALEILRTNNMM